MWEDTKEDFREMKRGWDARGYGGWSRKFREAYVDYDESEDEFIISVELPGIERENIKIVPTDEDITIKAIKKTQEETDEGEFYRSERTKSGFYTRIPMPEEADTEEITARFRGGVLEIRIPKLEDEEESYVDIEEG